MSVAYLDSVQARLASLRELQSQTGEELTRCYRPCWIGRSRESCDYADTKTSYIVTAYAARSC